MLVNFTHTTLYVQQQQPEQQEQQQCIWCAINWRSAGTYFKSICSTASRSLTMPCHAPPPPPPPLLFSLYFVLLATTRLLKRYRKCYRKQNDLMAAIATPWGSSISTRAWAAFHSIYPATPFPRVSISIPKPFWLHSIHCRHWGQHKKKVRNIKGCAAWRRGAAEVHLDRGTRSRFLTSAREKITDPLWPKRGQLNRLKSIKFVFDFYKSF